MKIFEDIAILTEPEQALLGVQRAREYVTELDVWPALQQCYDENTHLWTEYEKRPSIACVLYPEICRSDERYDMAIALASEVLYYEIEQCSPKG